MIILCVLKAANFWNMVGLWSGGKCWSVSSAVTRNLIFHGFVRIHLNNHPFIYSRRALILYVGNIVHIRRRPHHLWRDAKFNPILSYYGLWAERVVSRATPAVTWGLGYCGLFLRPTNFSCLICLVQQANTARTLLYIFIVKMTAIALLNFCHHFPI